MLDLKRIREEEAVVRQALANRRSVVDLDAVLELDQRRRAMLQQVEQLKQERNSVSKQIGEKKRAGEDTAEIQATMRSVGEQISGLDESIRTVEAELDAVLLTIPNVPYAEAPVGPDDSANRLVKTVGTPRTFDFEPQPHVALAEQLGLVDFVRGAKLSGAGFVVYRGQGARLERALIQFMLDLHTQEHGYTEISPPFVVNTASMTGTGQLPKMAEDMYAVPADDLYLIPTAEVPVTNLHRDEIIDAALPLRYVAYTPCFRREAGAAGRETRGLIRMHQFDKVELVQFVEPSDSYAALESLLGHAEAVLQRLELPYRVRELCTGDLSFAAARCYDIELWAPGQNDWLEVSSCSNFEDFQARRAKIRYRTPEGKVALAHTLNGSGVALARLFVAILENYQQADGRVRVPDPLVPYLGGLTELGPA
jgi:seryl-tRNA synthetase